MSRHALLSWLRGGRGRSVAVIAAPTRREVHGGTADMPLGSDSVAVVVRSRGDVAEPQFDGAVIADGFARLQDDTSFPFPFTPGDEL